MISEARRVNSWLVKSLRWMLTVFHVFLIYRTRTGVTSLVVRDFVFNHLLGASGNGRNEDGGTDGDMLEMGGMADKHGPSRFSQ